MEEEGEPEAEEGEAEVEEADEEGEADQSGEESSEEESSEKPNSAGSSARKPIYDGGRKNTSTSKKWSEKMKSPTRNIGSFGYAVEEDEAPAEESES